MSYDNRPRIAKATRFFARLISFDLECPHCGDVYSIRMGASRARATKGAKRDVDPNWDPWTARFKCTNKNCAKQYILGLLAWPIMKAPSVASATPADQVPGPRELAQMRKEGGGWWMEDAEGQRYARPHETNLTTEEERPDRDDDDDI